MDHITYVLAASRLLHSEDMVVRVAPSTAADSWGKDDTKDPGGPRRTRDSREQWAGYGTASTAPTPQSTCLGREPHSQLPEKCQAQPRAPEAATGAQLHAAGFLHGPHILDPDPGSTTPEGAHMCPQAPRGRLALLGQSCCSERQPHGPGCVPAQGVLPFILQDPRGEGRGYRALQ